MQCGYRGPLKGQAICELDPVWKVERGGHSDQKDDRGSTVVDLVGKTAPHRH